MHSNGFVRLIFIKDKAISEFYCSVQTRNMCQKHLKIPKMFTCSKLYSRVAFGNNKLITWLDMAKNFVNH